MAEATNRPKTKSKLPPLFSGGRSRLFAGLIVIGVLQAVTAVIVALATRDTFNALLVGQSVRASGSFGFGMTPTLIILLAAAGAGVWLRWRGDLEAERFGQSYVHAVRVALFRRLTGVGAEALRTRASGALALRFSGDLTALRNWVSLGLARLVVSGLAVGLTLAALVWIEPVVAAALALALVMVGCIAFGLGPSLTSRARIVRDRRGSLAGVIQDRIGGLAAVEAFGQERREVRRIAKKSRAVRDACVRRARSVAALRATGEAGALLSGLVALVTTAWAAGSGNASAGSAAAAIMLAGLLGPRVQELGRVWEYRTAAVVAYDKLRRLMAIPAKNRARPSKRQETLPEVVTTGLRVVARDVALAPCLQKIDLAVEPGQRIVITGPSGAGKSVLIRVLAGLTLPDEGSVQLDGVEAGHLAPAERAGAVALVSSDLPLLRGSMRLNLRYGAADPADERLRNMLAKLGLEALEDRLGGLDARIAERGAGLSAGERIRLILARALLSEPRLLLLDEADANLDGESRDRLDAAIAEFPGTVIAVTHDRARAGESDRAWRLENGRLTPLAGSPSLQAVS